jgi:alanyl-tRNA synthetase
VLREIGDILDRPAEAPAPAQASRSRILEKQLGRKALARSKADDILAGAREVNGIAVVAGRIDGLDAEALRGVVDTIRDRLGSGVVCVGSVVDGKVSLVAAVTKDLKKRVQAGRIVQEVAKVVGGGDQAADLAQAGGRIAARSALALVCEIARTTVVTAARGRQPD